MPDLLGCTLHISPTCPCTACTAPHSACSTGTTRTFPTCWAGWRSTWLRASPRFPPLSATRRSCWRDSCPPRPCTSRVGGLAGWGAGWAGKGGRAGGWHCCLGGTPAAHPTAPLAPNPARTAGPQPRLLAHTLTPSQPHHTCLHAFCLTSSPCPAPAPPCAPLALPCPAPQRPSGGRIRSAWWTTTASCCGCCSSCWRRRATPPPWQSAARTSPSLSPTSPTVSLIPCQPPNQRNGSWDCYTAPNQPRIHPLCAPLVPAPC